MATYQIDPTHTLAEFSVKHMMFTTVKGQFGKVSGEIHFDEADPTRSSVVAQVETASIDTREPQRDAHLRSPDFFDAEKFPVITFKSKRIERNGSDSQFRVIGDLTIRDVTREVVLDSVYLGQNKDPWGGTRAHFTGTATINRKDFGLQWNVPLEAGGWLVGDTVKIDLEVESVRKD